MKLQLFRNDFVPVPLTLKVINKYISFKQGFWKYSFSKFIKSFFAADI
jgi:hypothetical protein